MPRLYGGGTKRCWDPSVHLSVPYTAAQTGPAEIRRLPPESCGLVGPILWGHSSPLCHALSLLWTSILHCHSPGVATVARRLRYSWLWLILVVVSTVATPGEWQCKIDVHNNSGSVKLEQAACGSSQWRMGPTFFKCFLFSINKPINK